jgi:hypothetical protein
MTRYGFATLDHRHPLAQITIEQPKRPHLFTRLLAATRTAADFLEHMLFTAVALAGAALALYLAGLTSFGPWAGVLIGIVSYGKWANRK